MISENMKTILFNDDLLKAVKNSPNSISIK